MPDQSVGGSGGPLWIPFTLRKTINCEHSPRPRAQASSRPQVSSRPQASSIDSRRRHPGRCGALVCTGRRAAPVSRLEPYAFCRVFPGADCLRLPGFPGGAKAGGYGAGEGGPAGHGLSVLGGEPVLAQSTPGFVVQRYCDRAFCPGCISGHRRPAGGIERELFS
jgi:hypothetical protein